MSEETSTMSDLLRNARLARPGTSALDGVLIVTGDYLDAKLWDAILYQNTAAGPKYWVGSFAATHEFLSAACDAFGKRVFDESSAASWDPYFWQALQSPSRESWDELIRHEQGASLTGLQCLLDSVPDFFELVQYFRTAFEQRVGRPMKISVFDFGEPYWIDAGNHAALSSSIVLGWPGSQWCR